MTINTKEPVQYVSGQHRFPARVLADDIKNADGRTLLVAIDFGGDEMALQLSPDGVCDAGHLENIPEEHTETFWLNAYDDGVGPDVYASRAAADREAAPHRIACLEITRTYTKGEGL